MKPYNEDGKARKRWDRDFGVYASVSQDGVMQTNKALRDVHDHDTKSDGSDSEGGFLHLAGAESLAVREYTKRAEAPIHTLLIQKKIAFGESVRISLLEKMEKDGFQLLSRDFSPPFRDGPSGNLLDNSVWVGPNGVISLTALSSDKSDEASDAVCVSTNQEMLKSYWEWWTAQIFNPLAGRISTAKISGIFNTQHGLTIRRFYEPVGHPFEVENYDPSVVAFYEKARSELAAKNPSGRLLLLDGPPGTGKTFLLRGLVHDLAEKAEFVYLPASMVATLDGPGMMSILEHEDNVSPDDVTLPKIFVVEDADECLISRAADNMSSIRNLLNFCDGFLGALLDIRIVATTNSGHVGRTDKIDAALLRPGRLLAKATVGNLSADQTCARLAQLTGKDDWKVGGMALSSLYALARENGWVQKA